jgi:hypothetical protein
MTIVGLVDLILSEPSSLSPETKNQSPKRYPLTMMMKHTTTMRATTRKRSSRFPFLLQVGIFTALSTCSSNAFVVTTFSPQARRLQPRRRTVVVSLKAATLHDFNAPRRKISGKHDVLGYPPQATFDANHVKQTFAQVTHFVSAVVPSPLQNHHQQRIPHIWDTPFIISHPNRQAVADVAEMTVGLLLVLFATHWILTFMEPAMGTDLTCAARWAAINGFLVTLAVRLPHHISHSRHES